MWGISYYGTNQVEVQRVLSLSNSERAKSTLQMAVFPATLVYVACNVIGIVLYSVYYKCDPILNKDQTGLERYDQIVPAYIVNRFNLIPGMTGLCIAGIFSAALSSISSSLNSIASVTVIDIIKPLYRKGTMSDMQVVWCAKILSLVYGAIYIGLSFCFMHVKSILQLMNVMVGSLEGPVLAIFLIGVLTTKASDKCVSFAMIVGYILTACLGFGTLFSDYLPPPLPLTTSDCAFQNATNQLNVSSSILLNNFPMPTQDTDKDVFILFKISFIWYGTIGCILTLLLVFLAVVVTGWKKNVIPENSICLSPVTKLWMKSNTALNTQLQKKKFEVE